MATTTRSPQYPQLNLEEAVERIKKVYKAETWHPTTDAIIAGHLGYKGLNGASLGIVATLKRYGLLHPVGDGKFKVSEDAVTIIEADSNDPARAEAMVRCGLRPQLFADLYEKYGPTPPSDQSLRHELIVKRKFNPNSVEDVIRVYRQTLEIVVANQADYTEETPNDSEEDFSMQPQQAIASHIPQTVVPSVISPTLPAPQPQQKLGKELRFATFEGSEAVLHLPADVTRESISLIVALLQAQQVVFPPKQQFEPIPVATAQTLPPTPSAIPLPEHVSEAEQGAGGTSATEFIPQRSQRLINLTDDE